MSASTPARLYCTLVGGALVILGLIGLFYSSGFDTGTSGVAGDTDDVFGVLSVNGWDNLLYIALGLAALAVAGSASGARSYALAVGLLFVLLAIWGFADSDGILLGILPVNDADNVLHLLLGLIGLGAGAATATTAKPARPKPRRAPRRGRSQADAPKPGRSKPDSKPDRSKPGRSKPDASSA